MRTVNLIAIAFLLALSGCATRWTVFGHSMGGSAPAASATQPAAVEPPPRAVPTTSSAPPARPSQPASAPELRKIKAIEVTFTAAAREKIATEPTFREDSLVAAIETELRAQQLLNESDPKASDTIEIVIDDFVTRTVSNAVVFGYVLSTGTLQGSLEVRAPNGQQLLSSRIQARSRLTKPAGAGQASSFEPLYQGFADLTARNLTGAPEPVGVNH